MKKIAVMTTGGDAPGMNAAIRAAVRTAVKNGMEVVGVEEGFKGLVRGIFRPMDSKSVSNIINKGGTILKTLRCPEFKLESVRKKAYANIMEHGVEGIVVIGGDGSKMGAWTITKELKVPTFFIPASIDNDVYGTDLTIGFDTAVNVALEAIDKIRDTASSHERIFIVEIMGREHGFLSLEVGLTGGAEVILLPEFKKDHSVKEICGYLKEGINKGKTSSIIVMAEGAGSAADLAKKMKKFISMEIRYSVLGYIQRGGNPTAESRRLGLLYGYEAAAALKKMKPGESKMAGLKENRLVIHNTKSVINKERKIDSKLYKINKIFSH
ncbi:MAG: ATP-dependent 6-phosphofructokinase [Candidatus Goldiibacteriota bacterium]